MLVLLERHRFVFVYLAYIITTALGDTTCSNLDFLHVNATGSVSVPGFIYGQNNTSVSSSNLTFSSAIIQQNLSPVNTSRLLQSFYLDAQPVVSTPLPYWGCMSAFTAFSPPRHRSGHNASTLSGCQGVFSSNCYTAILATANQAIFQYALQNTSDVENICTAVVTALTGDTFPKECDKQEEWGQTDTSTLFGSTNPQDPNNNCSANVFNGTASQNAPLEAGTFAQPVDNFSVYDEWATQSTPVLLTAWSKNATDSLEGFWMGSRLVCLQMETFSSGSRVPTSAASRHRSSDLSLVLGSMLGLAVLIVELI